MKKPSKMNPVNLLRRLMGGYDAGDNITNVLASSGGRNIVSRSLLPTVIDDRNTGLSSAGDTVPAGSILPADRLSRYTIFDQMARSPTLSAALNIHVSHALAQDKKSGMCFNLAPVDTADKETSGRCNEIMNDLGDMLNSGLPSWALNMAIYGVSYIRPYAKESKGITSLESSYYTLPHFTTEYERGGALAGFSGDYFIDPVSNQRVLAKPWEMVAMKVPYWTPDINNRPMNTGTVGYSLLSDPAQRPLIETQNYGTSFLEYSYESFVNLCDALRALKATRNNAAKIDRLIALATNQLDPVNAAAHARNVGQSLKRSSEEIMRASRNSNVMPTVYNHIVPVMGDGKGGITIDTQFIPADITGIEDVMFHLRQLCSTVGVDATMLGWADQMAGGLGDGGWQQTAIQSAQRSYWIRQAAVAFIYRTVDIHCAYKYGKVYQHNNRPFRVEFNSVNTALQAEANREQESRANYVSVVVSILDAVQNNARLAGSPALMNMLFSEMLQMNDDTIAKVYRELSTAKPDDSMMESAGWNNVGMEDLSREDLLSIFRGVMA
ncbi:phage portal protein [Serratia marcescens]